MRLLSFTLPCLWRLSFLIPVVCCVSCSSGTTYNPVHGKVLYKNEPIEAWWSPSIPEERRSLPSCRKE